MIILSFLQSSNHFSWIASILQINELGVSLSQVHATAENTNELLEHEVTERMRLEEEMEKLKEEHEKLRNVHDDVQTELIEAKVEQPIESTIIPELSSEIDLSLDGMFLVKAD